MSGRAILEGKTAVVTGGSGGIGAACAEALIRDGARVLLMGRREEKLLDVRRRLLSRYANASVTISVGDALSPIDMQRTLECAHGLAGSLDIVVATVGGGDFKPLLMQELEGLRRELDMNISPAFLALRYGVPLMGEGGSVVLISSTAGVMPFPFLSGYCAGKAGLEAFMRSAADELASTGVRVNAVRPGMTRTEATAAMFESDAVMARYYDQIPLARGGEPEEIAQAVRYLAGPESAWVTGQSVAVDGGQELRRHPDMSDMVAGLFGEDALAAVQSGQSYP